MAPPQASVPSATTEPEVQAQAPTQAEAPVVFQVQMPPKVEAAPPSSPVAVIKQIPPVDIWERIRRGFAMPNLEFVSLNVTST